MLLILSIYSEENLIDDEGTIIQTLTFTLGVAMQNRVGGGRGRGGTKVKYISLQIILIQFIFPQPYKFKSYRI